MHPATQDNSTRTGSEEISSLGAAAPHSHSGPRWYQSAALPLAAMFLCLGTAGLVALWQGHLSLENGYLRIHWAYPMILAAAAVAGSIGLFLHRWMHWSAPLRRLRATLGQVRQGKSPIDELSHVGGCLTPLAEDVQSLLRELRLQRMEVALLEQEMRQRVANRTDALERSLGTLRQQASRDALTGVYNRRMFDQCLPALVQRARSEESPLTLLMIDVDFFKTVNDTLGHAAGDDLLRNIGQLLRSTLRETDLPFRFGGDEFSVILPNTPAAEAEPMGQRLCSLVDALAKTLRVAPSPRLSIGLCALGDLPPGASPQEFLELADRNLYAAKTTRKARDGQVEKRVA